MPEAIANTKKKKNIDENLSPKFVTYREQIDGQYWFPTYIKADDTLHFRFNDVHLREIIKLTNYKRFGAKTTIIYKGEAKEDPKGPDKKPEDPNCLKRSHEQLQCLIPKGHPPGMALFVLIC